MEIINHSNGIIDVPVSFSVNEVLDRFEAVLRTKGLGIFARIDQKTEAEKVGLTLRPTELLLFGNPRAGTPLMQATPSIALDLPLKVLAWQDGSGQVWLSYNDPAYLQERHDLPGELVKNIAVIPALIQASLALQM